MRAYAARHCVGRDNAGERPARRDGAIRARAVILRGSRLFGNQPGASCGERMLCFPLRPASPLTESFCLRTGPSSRARLQEGSTNSRIRLRPSFFLALTRNPSPSAMKHFLSGRPTPIHHDLGMRARFRSAYHCDLHIGQGVWAGVDLLPRVLLPQLPAADCRGLHRFGHGELDAGGFERVEGRFGGTSGRGDLPAEVGGAALGVAKQLAGADAGLD